MATRQTALLIRNDGMLYPSTPNTRRLTNFWPYSGDPKWPLEKRMAWLQGSYRSTVDEASLAAETGAFDLEKANKTQILEYVFTEFGVKLDARKNEDVLRREVKKLAEKDLLGDDTDVLKA